MESVILNGIVCVGYLVGTIVVLAKLTRVLKFIAQVETRLQIEELLYRNEDLRPTKEK